MLANEQPLRILIVCDLWQGSDSYAIARALRRAGHSVTIVSEQMFGSPGWTHPLLKTGRRLLRPLIARDFNRALLKTAKSLQPHLLFVCKGVMVTPATIAEAKRIGAVAALWWPDVSFFAHGPYIPRAVPSYDWIFTTKTFGLRDLREKFGYFRASFMPHAYHPEVHRKFPCDASDHARYDCDVSFIGTWSPKKQVLLEALVVAKPGIDLKIWGAQWDKAGPRLKKWVRSQEIFGAEYAKAIRLSKINLGILSEVRAGSTSGDLITARTFHIPACGGFMLHERTDEAVTYFEEGRECAFFQGADEMIAQIDHFLGNPAERETVAEAGHLRCLNSGNAVDDRMRTVLAKVDELRFPAKTLEAPIGKPRELDEEFHAARAGVAN
jgi:spore maturation protein CgeB